VPNGKWLSLSRASPRPLRRAFDLAKSYSVQPTCDLESGSGKRLPDCRFGEPRRLAVGPETATSSRVTSSIRRGLPVSAGVWPPESFGSCLFHRLECRDEVSRTAAAAAMRSSNAFGAVRFQPVMERTVPIPADVFVMAEPAWPPVYISRRVVASRADERDQPPRAGTRRAADAERAERRWGGPRCPGCGDRVGGVC